ncbi:protein prenylyltransferase [Whalleya microplaca]|nr:protein prenylyltransferase [Whalleya microplaca]
MASHGVARTARITRTEEQRQQDLDKINKYRELEHSIRAQVSQDSYDNALFQLTSKLLRLNPEYYTIWNVRRRCLISSLLSRSLPGSSPSKASQSGSHNDTTKPSSESSFPSSSDAIPQGPKSLTTGKSGTTVDSTACDKARDKDPESDVHILQSELAFTIPLLLEFPKCYWIWKYRKWVLEQAIVRLPVPVARKIWEAELALASKMLTKDRRNFHAWGYRRHVVAALESSSLAGKSMAEDEFAYTTKMIHADLSNFSAWHNRTQLILRVLGERGADDATRKAFLDQELDLVREALNVGPDDQSLWYYHQYLMSQIVNHDQSTIAPALTVQERIAYVKREIGDVKDLLEDYDGTKWIYEILLEYSIALRQLGQRGDEDDQKEDPRKWLGMVRGLDPMRAGRWNDIEKQLDLSQQ